MTGPFEELMEAWSSQRHWVVEMSLNVATSPMGLLFYEARKCSWEAK